MIQQSLQNRVRVFRAEHRMTQADLARAIGVSRKTISTIEVGRFVPSTLIALQIARYFGVPLEEIFWIEEALEEVRTPKSASEVTPPHPPTGEVRSLLS